MADAVAPPKFNLGELIMVLVIFWATGSFSLIITEVSLDLNFGEINPPSGGATALPIFRCWRVNAMAVFCLSGGTTAPQPYPRPHHRARTSFYDH